MAEINTPAAGSRKAGGRRSKKLSTHIDLTPMVDLGFLLITFFIFTTQMSTAKRMDLVLPADGIGITVGKTAALTVVLLPGNKVFYYHGELVEAMQTGVYGITGFSVTTGIGQVIRDKQLMMDRTKTGYAKDLMLMIKASDRSICRNVVDILDEVLINAVPHYAFVDVTAEEKKAMAAKGMDL